MRRAGVALVVLAVLAAAPVARAAEARPTLVHDVKSGAFTVPAGQIDGSDPIQDYVQPDTQAEPSIAVNPQNPLNVVTAYQEGRIANGGDFTNGYATSFDGGKTWTSGELPKLTRFPGQGGTFERASDAVVAFGPNNVVYANSLVFEMPDPITGLTGPSGIAINVSKDGGKTWGDPVLIQSDQINNFNDKNWMIVDNSDAPGHHKGRVYVVWDQIAPILYDYCDHDCDKLENWLPRLQTIPATLFPGQGLGAYPVIQKNGGLGIVVTTLTNAGAPTGEEPEPPDGTDQLVYISAPFAGQTPYPAPLEFLPPVKIAQNESNGTAAQRASDGIPAAAVEPNTGDIFAVWDDGRFRDDTVNDAVISKGSPDGTTWSKPKRVNPGGTKDGVNHYNVAISAEAGRIHVTYRQRDQSKNAPLFTDAIDTYYQQSRDAGANFSAPLKINEQTSHPWYGAFSRNGTFEGDYDQTASAGGYTYTARDQGEPVTDGEPPALTKASASTIALTPAGKGHQHQRNWVALVRDLVPAEAPVDAPSVPAPPEPGENPPGCVDRRKFKFRLHHPRHVRVIEATAYVDGKRKAHRRGRSLKTLKLPKLPQGKFTVRIVTRLSNGKKSISKRRYFGCTKSKPTTHSASR